MTPGHFHLGDVGSAQRLVERFHYSHLWPSNALIVGTFHHDGGLFGDSGEAYAACVFGYPAARWSEPVLELVRLVRAEAVDVSLSQLVSTTSQWAHKKGHPLLVSYADATQGHHGGIYQACSWNYDGQRARRMDGVLINGEFMPGRNANHLYGTQSPRKLIEQGVAAEPHYDEGKHLYWRSRGRAGRKRAERLGLRCAAYPKPNPVERAA